MDSLPFPAPDKQGREKQKKKKDALLIESALLKNHLPAAPLVRRGSGERKTERKANKSVNLPPPRNGAGSKPSFRRQKTSPRVVASYAKVTSMVFRGRGPKNGGSRRGAFRRAERFSGCLFFISAPEPPRSGNGAGRTFRREMESGIAPRNGAGSKPSFRMQRNVPHIAAWNLSGREEISPFYKTSRKKLSPKAYLVFCSIFLPRVRYVKK